MCRHRAGFLSDGVQETNGVIVMWTMTWPRLMMMKEREKKSESASCCARGCRGGGRALLEAPSLLIPSDTLPAADDKDGCFFFARSSMARHVKMVCRLLSWTAGGRRKRNGKASGAAWLTKNRIGVENFCAFRMLSALSKRWGAGRGGGGSFCCGY